MYNSEDDYNSNNYKKADHIKNYGSFQETNNGKVVCIYSYFIDLTTKKRHYRPILYVCSYLFKCQIIYK